MYYNFVFFFVFEVNAEREMDLFFKKEEIINYSVTNKICIYFNDHIDKKKYSTRDMKF